MNPRAWTTSDIETLRRLASQGMPIATVALRLGRTHQAVRSQARKLGVKFKALSAQHPSINIP